ncbi:MAG: nucleotidyltransferase domain-containing protein [Planctomycetota bacterium]
MCKVCNIDIKHSEKTYKKLSTFVGKLKKSFPVKDVYLYGSFARGDFHEGSDIDLVIVGDFKEKFFERIANVLELTNLPIEPLVYTQAEFERTKKKSSFLKKVVREGVKL